MRICGSETAIWWKFFRIFDSNFPLASHKRHAEAVVDVSAARKPSPKLTNVPINGALNDGAATRKWPPRKNIREEPQKKWPKGRRQSSAIWLPGLRKPDNSCPDQELPRLLDFGAPNWKGKKENFTARGVHISHSEGD